MKNNWQTKKLEEIADFQKGKLMQNSTIKTEGAAPYILIDDLRTNQFAHYTSSNKGTACISKDTLLAWDGANAGTVGGGLEGFVGSTITKISPKDEVEPLYLRMFLSSKFKEFNSHTHGAAVPHLDKEFVLGYPIPLPPIDKQKEIVNKLDSIRKLQELNQREIDKVEELYQSKLNLFFTDDCTDCKKISLSNFVKVQGGYAFKSKEFTKDGLQLVRMGNVKKGYMDLLSNPVFLPEIYRQKYKNYLLNTDDVLISMTGTVGKEDYGNVVKVEYDGGLLLNQRVGKLTIIDNKLLSNYLYYYCQSSHFRNQIFSRGKGIRQANISGEQIGCIVFLNRNTQLQEEIVCYLA